MPFMFCPVFVCKISLNRLSSNSVSDQYGHGVQNYVVIQTDTRSEWFYAGTYIKLTMRFQSISYNAENFYYQYFTISCCIRKLAKFISAF